MVVEACRLRGWQATEGISECGEDDGAVSGQWCVESGTGKVDLDGGKTRGWWTGALDWSGVDGD